MVTGTRLNRGAVTLLVTVMLVNLFSPLISLVAFHWDFEKHLLECQLERHHHEDCQASCLLEEVMPEPSEAIPETTTSFSYFSPVYFQYNQLAHSALHRELFVVNIFSQDLLVYTSPFLGMHSPPPKLG